MSESFEPPASGQPEKAQLSEKEAKFVEVIARVEAVVKKLREFAQLRKVLLAAVVLHRLSDLEKVVSQIPSPDDGGYAEDLSTMDEEVSAARVQDSDEATQGQIAGSLRESSIRLQTFTEFVIHQGKLKELDSILAEAINKSADTSALLEVLEKANRGVLLAESTLERMHDVLAGEPSNELARKAKQDANLSRTSTIQQYRELALGYASRLDGTLKEEVVDAFADWLGDPPKTFKLYKLIDAVRAKTADNFNTLRIRNDIKAVTQGLPLPGEINRLLEDLVELAAAQSTKPTEQADSEAKE